MCIWVTILTCCEVSVERVNDRVFLFFLSSHSGPHSNTGPTSVSKHCCTNFMECIDKTISFNGISHLFTTGGNGEFRVGFKASVGHLLSQTGSSTDILVTGVGTTTY